MSLGFHYFEAVKQSLALQWLSKEDAPQVLGKLISVAAITSLIVYGVLWILLELFELDYVWNLLISGIICALLALVMWLGFPHYKSETEQHNKLIVRKRYWLYYALTFFSGARRQIFMVFAAFLMVEKFGYSAAQVTALFLINYAFNWLFAEKIGVLIRRIGERKSLTIEYAGLIIVFTSYALVENAYIAAGLYVIDHMFFALYIAMSTYFQKIADPADFASSAGVSFTINHIAAVVIPALLGVVWISSNAAVFLIGTGFAICSLGLAQNPPGKPAGPFRASSPHPSRPPYRVRSAAWRSRGKNDRSGICHCGNFDSQPFHRTVPCLAQHLPTAPLLHAGADQRHCCPTEKPLPQMSRSRWRS